MGQVFSSTRFWISVLVCIAATLLAALKVISGDLAIGTMSGLVGGFGVGKAWGGASDKATPTAPSAGDGG